MKYKNPYINTTHSRRDVWFDDISISNYRGAVLDEYFYYPFGLTLSSESAEEAGQPYKFQTKELEKSFGLEMYDFHARMYDPQLGRFNSVDPMASKFASISPFTGMENNPVMYIDPYRSEPVPSIYALNPAFTLTQFAALRAKNLYSVAFHFF